MNIRFSPIIDYKLFLKEKKRKENNHKKTTCYPLEKHKNGLVLENNRFLVSI